MRSPFVVRPLGATGLEITRVGFGAWAIGGAGWAFGWSRQDDAESVAAIRHAVERGINWIDTAAVYGLGHSEEIVARALREIPERERPYVFTKGGLVWDEQNRATQPRRVGDARSLRREVEASLRRLEVERIDLYQMHRPAEDGTPVEQYWQTLLDLKAEGKVRAVGSRTTTSSSSRRPSAGATSRRCSRLSPRSGVRPPRRSCHGAPLTGRAPSRTARCSVGAVAVAWTLAWPGVTGAIVGARRPSQIDGWLPAASLELTEADLDDVADALERTGAGAGPTRPGRSHLTGMPSRT